MKAYLKFFSNRVIALYLIWIFLQIILILLSGNLSNKSSNYSNFFPFTNSSQQNVTKQNINVITIDLIYKHLREKFDLPDYYTFKQNLLNSQEKRWKVYQALSEDFTMPSFNDFEISTFGYDPNENKQNQVLGFLDFRLSAYGYLELIFYSALPGFLFFIIRLFKHKLVPLLVSNYLVSLFSFWVFIHFVLLLLSGSLSRNNSFD